MQVITFCNQKGGVGKTTTAINFAVNLVKEHNKKVLLIDLDSQENTSSIFGKDENTEKTIADLFSENKENGENVSLESLIYRTDSIDIIFGNTSLENAGRYLLASDTKASYKLFFKMKELRDKNYYDYVIIDTPPSKSIIVENGIIASDKIIIPIQAEKFSFDGCSKQITYIQNLNESLITFNLKPIEITGFLFTLVEKNNLHKDYVENGTKLLKDNGYYVFNSIIHKNIDLAKSQDKNKTIAEYEKRAKGNKDYQAFTNEFLNKGE